MNSYQDGLEIGKYAQAERQAIKNLRIHNNVSIVKF